MPIRVYERHPAVAGTFYEADPKALKEQLKWCFTHKLGPGSLPSVKGHRSKESVGYIVPHAGYVYSGPIAAHAYFRLAGEGTPETIVLIGPNHTGTGSLVSAMAEGVWLTPLGGLEVDAELAKTLVRNSGYIDVDPRPHMYEHSIEVQLPFIQYLYGDGVRIVPLVVLQQTPEVARDIASALREAIHDVGRDVIVIASTDFSHYEPYDTAVKKDKMALKMIESLDPEGLYSVISEYDVSMCGPGPVMALLYLARGFGAVRSEVLAYATSGDTSGDKASVVGYASIRVPYGGG